MNQMTVIIIGYPGNDRIETYSRSVMKADNKNSFNRGTDAF